MHVCHDNNVKMGNNETVQIMLFHQPHQNSAPTGNVQALVKVLLLNGNLVFGVQKALFYSNTTGMNSTLFSKMEMSEIPLCF